ncbi:MAG: Fpg/Nei family DNA glycosylase [Candidatus Binataceae bacterium]
MPELPDIAVYIEALNARIVGRRLERIRLASPFLLRTAAPPVTMSEGKQVIEVRRIGKRIAIGLEDDLWLVLHLMIAGRLHWSEGEAKVRRGAAVFEFSNGSLLLTEAGTQKRASLHLMAGEAGLRAIDPGGVEVLETDQRQFAAMLKGENHTLKRALTDPRLLSGIGNAYSDEILFAARLSPAALTQKLSETEMAHLFEATRTVLTDWIERLRARAGGGFPEKVTAFQPGMAVHGRYRQPCPRCNAPIQRIRYAANEANYCARCQTGGRLLADRALSRLMHDDWPRTLDELEAIKIRGAK